MFLVAAGKVSEIIGPANHVLEKHSRSRGFTCEWEWDGVLGTLLSAAMCTLVTVSNLMIGLLWEPERLPWLCLTSYAVVTFIMTTQCLSHVISFLDLVVNSFVDQFLRKRNLTTAVKSWNSVQSLLQHVSQVMARCLIVLQIFVTLTLLTCLLRLVLFFRDIRQGTFPEALAMVARTDNIHGITASYMNALVVLALSVRLFIKAASVTESCTRIPSLINSFHIDAAKEIDCDQQHLVTYIKNSDAGFYLNGTRLTASILIKVLYFLGAFSCTAVSTALSG